MKTVITVYKDAAPAHLVKGGLALLSKRPRGKPYGCSIVSIPALLWTVIGGPHSPLCRKVLSYVGETVLVFPQELLVLFLPVQP